MIWVYLMQTLFYPAQRYVGLTCDLERRLAQHDGGLFPTTAPYRP